MSVEFIDGEAASAITADDIRTRAKHYRFAAALADVRRDAALFNDLAMMFDQIAHYFG